MMDGSRVVELSFANGKIYKKTKRFNNESIQSYEQSEDCVSFYEQNTSSFTDPIFSLFAIKKYKNNETKIKYYRPSRQVYKEIEGRNSTKGVDISEYDLCPDVSLWVGIASYNDDDDNSEIIFAVDDDENLKVIADYYSLPFPLPKNESLDTNPKEWHSNDFYVAVSKSDNVECESKFLKDFKLGSIKFTNKKPILLKMYKSNFKDKTYAKKYI
jgi:hypothetical protein